MKRTGTDPGLRPVLLPAAPQPPAAGPERSRHVEALVERAGQGDVGAWSRLYQETFDAVFRHVCFLTGDPIVAEDLTQDAYARAFTSMARYDRRAPFVSWVRGIALNVVRMFWRRAETTDRVHDSLTRLGEIAPRTVGDPDLAHQQEQRMRVLYEVLATLPEHLREAFILRELEGTPTQQVALQLGITANNVAVRTARARAKIREELTRLGWLGGGA